MKNTCKRVFICLEKMLLVRKEEGRGGGGVGWGGGVGGWGVWGWIPHGGNSVCILFISS